ncbi:MAG: nicotinate phosphoribosyltransferase [Anaerolineae bacterium]|nr:nicotinate phosphoribosyltransferase [Anaerolineae bacterium]MDW8102138.1 nicotinate phosphoribosyltransferase [Anaerolineae bacterium]
MGKFPFSHPILSGETADVYFLRTKAILEAEGLNPVVTMEIFPNKPGVLCGIKEVLELLSIVLPENAEVWALDEGEEMAAKEVVLRIIAPYLSFGMYETAILGILAHESGWATAARECVKAAGDIPVISFGARHVHPEVAARMEYAAIVGGCAGCATTAGAKLAGIKPSGTMPHAMILIFNDTVKAIEAFDRHMPPDVPRIALVDTFKDEAEESLRVARALGRKLWGVRLDTPPERGRVTPELVKEVRARLDQAGFTWVKIVVSGGVDAERIRLFREAGAPVDAFGVGSAISGAPPIDFTADIKEVEGEPRAKRGRIPGRTHNPRLKKVELKKGGSHGI